MFSGTLPSLGGVKCELARRGILEFTQFTFPGYRTNWHHKVIGDAINELCFGKLRRLMIFTPPRAGKSEIVSRRLPAFFLGHNPSAEVIITSYAADLANRMNSSVQQIMESTEYKRLFHNIRLPGSIGDPSRKLPGVKKTRTAEFFQLVGNSGSLRSAGVGGGVTGMGFNLGIIDDPVKDAEEGMSQNIRDKVWDWYQSTFYTRQTGFSNGKVGSARILLCMTRWHDDDLAGRLLKLAKEEPDADQWKVIRIPALSDLDSISRGMSGSGDPRSEEDQGLWEESSTLSTESLRRTRKNVAKFFWTSLYQQTPTAEGGGYFQRGWFGKFQIGDDGWIHVPGRPAVHSSGCTFVAAVDPAASESQKADFTVIVVMCLTPTGEGLILDVIRERRPPNGIPPLLNDVASKYKIDHFVFESDGMQKAVVDIARSDFPNLPPIREVKHRQKKKLVRATKAIVRAENGYLFVPESAPWKEKFFDELEAFTGENDAHDDQVDALSYAVMQFGGEDAVEWASGGGGAILPSHLASPQRQESAEYKRPAAERRKLWGR